MMPVVSAAVSPLLGSNTPVFLVPQMSAAGLTAMLNPPPPRRHAGDEANTVESAEALVCIYLR